MQQYGQTSHFYYCPLHIAITKTITFKGDLFKFLLVLIAPHCTVQVKVSVIIVPYHYSSNSWSPLNHFDGFAALDSRALQHATEPTI